MKLRYKLQLLLCLFIVTLTTACYKDDSSEAFQPVSTITVSDSLTKGMLYVYQGDTLKLNPQLAFASDIPAEQLEFEWLAYDNSTLSSYVQPNVYMSTEHELKYLINATDFTLGQNYRLRFRVTDKRTGVSSFLAYNINIANKYGEGWLLLEDKAGTGDLSMVFPNGTVEHGVYSGRNTSPLTGPRKLDLTPFDVTDDISSTGKRMYILAQEGSQEYNYLTMVKKYDLSFLFFKAPVLNAERMVWESTITTANKYASIGVAINNGKVHSNLVGGFPGIKKWGDISLNPDGNINYNVAPFVAGGTTYPAVVYDNVGKRFYSVSTSSPSLLAFPTNASSVFDMNNVGLTMVFQDSANVVREFNAIMKDDANQAYLLKYKTTSTTDAPQITLAKVLMNAPDVLSLTAAAGSTHSPHIYYGVAEKLKSYETTSNTSTEAFTFPVSEKVSAMKYQRYAADKSGPQLVVATWDGAQGRLYYFPITNNGTLSAPSKVFSGFSKIIDMAYKRP